MIEEEIIQCMNESVVAWLATSSLNNEPNVSPKEAFSEFNGTIIIANIASPQSVKNIKANDKVCLSMINILTQKGFQLKGTAKILDKTHEKYKEMEQKLSSLTQGKFPFSTITQITINTSKPIIAPSYFIYPNTKEEDMINASKAAYKLKR